MNVIKSRLVSAAAVSPFIAEGFTETKLPGDIVCFLKKITAKGSTVTVTVDDGNDKLPTADGPCFVTVTLDGHSGFSRTNFKEYANQTTAVAEYASFVDELITDLSKTASVRTASLAEANRNAVMQLAGTMFDKMNADGFGDAKEIGLVMDVENGKPSGYFEYRGLVSDGTAGSNVHRDTI